MRCASSVRAAVAVLGLLAVLLSGCGRRGQLEPAPDPGAAAAAKGGDQLQPIAGRPKRVPITPPKTPFILDPLL